MRVLKNSGLPRRIETRVFATIEGEASQVVAGFSALGWIDEAGRPTEDLRRLVSAFGTEEFGSVLADVLPRAYPYLQELDLESAPNNALREAFVSYIGREPETLRNAETFFLCLATEAGRPMSEHFSRRANRGVQDAKRWLRVAETGVLEEEVTKPFGLDEPTKAKANSSEGISSLATKIVALLGEGDMTDEEKAAVVTFLSYLGRQLKREGQ